MKKEKIESVAEEYGTLLSIIRNWLREVGPREPGAVGEEIVERNAAALVARLAKNGYAWKKVLTEDEPELEINPNKAKDMIAALNKAGFTARKIRAKTVSVPVASPSQDVIVVVIAANKRGYECDQCDPGPRIGLRTLDNFGFVLKFLNNLMQGK